MMPSTVKYPETFRASMWSLECPFCGKIIGFDGPFDWAWTQGCFGDTKITPTDIDGAVERKQHFLIFETKNLGVPIPKGQQILLNNLRIAKSFTVIEIWGKDNPQEFYVIKTNGEKIGPYFGVQKAHETVANWYKWANGKIYV